jgi:hypothetical protein
MSEGESNTFEHEGELFSPTLHMVWIETGAK